MPFRDFESDGSVVLRYTFPPRDDGRAALPNHILQDHAERNGYCYQNRENKGLPETLVRNGDLVYSVKVTPDKFSIVRMWYQTDETHENSGSKPWADIIESLLEDNEENQNCKEQLGSGTL